MEWKSKYRRRLQRLRPGFNYPLLHLQSQHLSVRMQYWFIAWPSEEVDLRLRTKKRGWVKGEGFFLLFGIAGLTLQWALCALFLLVLAMLLAGKSLPFLFWTPFAILGTYFLTSLAYSEYLGYRIVAEFNMAKHNQTQRAPK